MEVNCGVPAGMVFCLDSETPHAFETVSVTWPLEVPCTVAIAELAPETIEVPPDAVQVNRVALGELEPDNCLCWLRQSGLSSGDQLRLVMMELVTRGRETLTPKDCEKVTPSARRATTEIVPSVSPMLEVVVTVGVDVVTVEPHGKLHVYVTPMVGLVTGAACTAVRVKVLAPQGMVSVPPLATLPGVTPPPVAVKAVMGARYLTTTVLVAVAVMFELPALE